MPAIYNVADAFICVSMVVFVLLVVLGLNLDGTRALSAKQQRAADAAASQADDGATVPSTQAGVTDAGRASRPEPDPRAPRDGRDVLGHDAT